MKRGVEKQNDNYVTMYHMNLINVSECGDMSSIEAPSTSYLRGCYEGVPEVITCACITGSCITGYDVTGTGSHETEMKGR